ncbi:hypothetical protein QR680_012615 [Steinernema hermaphroditum]|uniref:Uncharacterized protein n=1 Tax=Steinernema hermaphroditum TaxID=289476 RepID=A0AA39I2K3_9BILA|nr:hypothetical protein QR680_012615 [Steinernema hermaphroditum]
MEESGAEFANFDVHPKDRLSPTTKAGLYSTLQILLIITTNAALIALMGDRRVATIVIGFQSFCLVLAFFFTVLCVARRKWGRLFDVLLHAYLISILLMTLISFFAVIFIPLIMIQSYRTLSLGQSAAYLLLAATYACSLAYQFWQKQPVENMLDYMQHHFK